jgi:hypothetical protein
MRATVGDAIHVHGRTVGSAEHRGEIREVRGKNGSPPYLVRFSNGQETLMFPGPDSQIEPNQDQVS